MARKPLISMVFAGSIVTASVLVIGILASTSNADTIATGRYLKSMNLVRRSGNLAMSSTKTESFTLTDSTLIHVDAVKFEATKFSWKSSNSSDVDFTNTKIEGSVWLSSNLGEANFKDSQMRGSTFTNVKFLSCSFDRADLRDVKFVQASISDCSFWRAIFNDQTTLPFDSEQAIRLGMQYAP